MNTIKNRKTSKSLTFDSLAAIIKDGEFSFTGQVTLPVLARIHLGQKSNIADIFLDSPHLYIECVNTLQLSNNNADTLNQLIITNVKGSRMDKTLREFNEGLSELKKSFLSDDEKQNLLFQKMYLFMEMSLNVSNLLQITNKPVRHLSSLRDRPYKMKATFDQSKVVFIYNTAEHTIYVPLQFISNYTWRQV